MSNTQSRSHYTSEPAANAIFVELGGPGLFYTINYDRMISENFGVRVGVGGFGGLQVTDDNGNTAPNGSLLMVPVTANYLACSKEGSKLGSSKFEVGAGFIYGSITGSFLGSNYSGSAIGETVTLGYRYQPSDGGFLFRAAFTPMIYSGVFIPYAGISLGAAF